jgi:hypothetical protein
MTDEHWNELFERLERIERTILVLAEWFDLNSQEESVDPDKLRRGAIAFRKLITEDIPTLN